MDTGGPGTVAVNAELPPLERTWLFFKAKNAIKREIQKSGVNMVEFLEYVLNIFVEEGPYTVTMVEEIAKLIHHVDKECDTKHPLEKTLKNVMSRFEVDELRKLLTWKEVPPAIERAIEVQLIIDFDQLALMTPEKLQVVAEIGRKGQIMRQLAHGFDLTNNTDPEIRLILIKSMLAAFNKKRELLDEHAAKRVKVSD